MNRSLLSLPLRSLLVAASVACAAHAAHGQAPVPAAQPAAADLSAPGRPSVLLLLPARSGAFARPADALREGFVAAHKVSGDDITLMIVDVDDGPDALAAALLAAKDRGVGVIVGPLPRAAVVDVIEGQRTTVPLVALNFPESDGAAPATMLALALSLEAEAQRIAVVALSEFVAVRTADTRPRIAIVARPGGLERRIAQAYLSALRGAGEVPRVIEWTPETAASVGRQLAMPSLEAVFLALTARDAAQMRALIPRGAQVFGTSLLNVGDPRVSPDAATLAHDLEGVRFVDMPWLLEPDNAGVMVYPPPAVPLATEMTRLYALGIDAYRVATAWMKGERRFDLDGVTGRLRIDRALSLRVERTPLVATYRAGELRRVDLAR
jgi:outer membrane PBP1 activator LpoA protein